MKYLALLLLAGCQSLTDVVVRVDADSMVVGEIASVSITVTDVDGSDGGTQVYASQALPICAAGQHDACYSFPITVTLKPGAHAPDTKVRVQVDAKGTDTMPFSSDAALFTFTPHSGKTLDFFLLPSCKATDCAAENLACGTSGCAEIAPRTSSAQPDLATPAPPATSVSLVSSQPGVVDAMSLAPYTIARADTVAGDLVITAFQFFATTKPQPVPAGWTLLGQIDLSTMLIYRFMDGTEGGNATLYDFTAPDFGGAGLTSNVSYMEYVWRGAVAPIHVVRSATLYADSASSTHVAFALDGAGAVSPGGELVGVVINDNGGMPSCDSTPSVTTTLATTFNLFQVANGVEGPASLSCNNANPGTTQASWLYSFVLDPAP